MIDETLYTDLIAPEKLRALVEACHAANMFPNDTWILAERIPAYVIRDREERQNLLLFAYFPPEMPLEKIFEEYTTGRIFTEQLELRWEQQEQDIRVVYLGAKKYEFVLRDYQLKKKEEALEHLRVQPPKSYFLFGQRLRPGDVSEIGYPAKDGDFAEARIPRLLRYPVPYDLENAKRREAEEEKKDGEKRSREYAKLHVREFLDERGSVAFFRFCGLTVEVIQQ